MERKRKGFGGLSGIRAWISPAQEQVLQNAHASIRCATHTHIISSFHSCFWRPLNSCYLGWSILTVGIKNLLYLQSARYSSSRQTWSQREVCGFGRKEEEKNKMKIKGWRWKTEARGRLLSWLCIHLFASTCPLQHHIISKHSPYSSHHFLS